MDSDKKQRSSNWLMLLVCLLQPDKYNPVMATLGCGQLIQSALTRNASEYYALESQLLMVVPVYCAS